MTDSAGLVAVSHVLDLAEELEGVVHRCDHIVKTISDQFDLSVEGGVRWKIAHGNGTESAEFAQKTRILLEHPNFKLKIQNLNEFDVEFWWELT